MILTYQKKKPLLIYHGGCDDGFAAAWCARAAMGPTFFEFYPGEYQKAPPDVTGRDVVMVDFSYKRQVIEKMAEQANHILILDHHKTAKEDLSIYPDLINPSVSENDGQKVHVLFDMNRAGATIAWDYYHNSKRPDFINYIEDRDLWRKLLPGGDEFTIALRSWPKDFDLWTSLIAEGPKPLIRDGISLQRYFRLRVEESKASAYKAIIFRPGGLEPWKVNVTNAPYSVASEVAGELATEDVDFGAAYFEVSAGRWKYSLRSRGNFDVSEVAKMFGGGGHKDAAGFSTDRIVHRNL